MSSHREAAQTALNARDFAAANVHALLDLADQQRMANLLAVYGSGIPDDIERAAVRECIRANLFKDGAQ